MTRKTRTFIIAEAGVNHNGNLGLALRLVDAAKDAGADAVKFQTFSSRSLATAGAERAGYQRRARGRRESQREMLARLELGPRAHAALLERCRRGRIEFLSSPFDLPGIDLLARLGLKTLKIPSGEITNLPYLRKIGALRRSLILSTGMSDLGEIEDALGVLVASGTPRERITLLHCTSEYPAPFAEVNLAALGTLREAFRLRVGYSDHTPGIEIAVAAVALGAEVLEKHFTLDRTIAGPDHRASLEPAELAAMVAAIRHVEAARGDGLKRASPSEAANIRAVRKSIVAARAIPKGRVLTERDIAAKRPAGGLSPMLWDLVIGRRAAKDYSEDDLIEL